jgi:hypothetical protein
MNHAYVHRALKLSAIMLMLSLIGEGLFQGVEWLLGTRAYLLFLYAGLSAVLLPFVPLDQQAGPAGPIIRLLVATVLFAVVYSNALIVSVVNRIGWSVGTLSLTVLPLWYVGTLCLLAGDRMLRAVRQRGANGS